MITSNNTFKGYTMTQIKSNIVRVEKSIAYLNKKYGYEVETKGTPNEVKEFNRNLQIWDNAKAIYNQMKAN